MNGSEECFDVVVAGGRPAGARPRVPGAESPGAARREPQPEPVAGALPPMAPRRTILDRLRQEHARDAGARVRHRSTFRGWRDGAVSLDGGGQVRTRLLIGAD